jgi:gamma-glutamyltranspeptidase/glutathione hydrolase
MGEGAQYGVSAAHPLAVDAGMEVLNNGGNAVDAAIAVSYMLGVVEPYASGIGGGGVMLIKSKESEPIVCDYREMTPMSGIVSTEKVGVPGLVKGMEKAHTLFGSVDMSHLLQPAIQVAEDGFAVGEVLPMQLCKYEEKLIEKDPAFFKNGTPLSTGEVLTQPLLAESLRSIQNQGSTSFYEGEIAHEISNRINGMEVSDFQRYKVQIRQPVISKYDDYVVWTSPPPFGGVTLLQALLTSEALKLHEHENRSKEYIHQWGEIIGQCYALRQVTMCDPNFHDISIPKLISEDAIKQLVANVNVEAVSTKKSVMEDVANTTHFVVIDKDGMVVSTTNTIGSFFGEGVPVGGFFLNNQMSNFTDDVNSPNRPYPGKRPQSYICPTILSNGQKTIAIGSAGGKRIPNMVAMILTDVVKRKVGIEDALASPRFFIDEHNLYTEKSLSPEVEKGLKQMGYEVNNRSDQLFYGGVHALTLSNDTGDVKGAADPRRGGSFDVRVSR